MGHGQGWFLFSLDARHELTRQIWVYLEARQIAESVSQIDEWIKVSPSDASSGKLSIG